MEFETILVRIGGDGRIGYITLNRPDRLNAINSVMRRELPAALAEWRNHPSVRVVVIEGAGGKAFSAGADIREFQGGKPHQFSTGLADFFTAPASFPLPVIAAIDGYCFGGGMELALACDFRLLTERSQLGQPEIKLGLIPGGGGTQRLARLVGVARAKEICMTGEPIEAARALAWGLADRVFAADQFEAGVTEFATRLASSAPVAVQMIKRVVDSGADLSMEAGLLLERQAFGLCFATEDMKEGVAAFLEKRSPQFKGL